MNGRIIGGILFALVLIALVGGIAVYAYNVGVSQGVIDSGKLVAPAQGAAPYLYHRSFFFHPFGFLGCLVPLFILFLIFGLMRMIFWGGHWGHGMHRGYGEQGVPPRFEEWHKRAHEAESK